MKLSRFLAAIGVAALVSTVQAQHGHLDAGATSQTQGAQLIWANGADFIESSGYVNTLYPSNSGRFAGYFNGNITLTALPATAGSGGPAPSAAALGSMLQFKMDCLEGPEGGSFGFWDTGSTQPSISLSPGQSSTNLWRLSNNTGAAGTDPFGHIHGRRFSATKPGIYKVGFTAVDVSSNGTGGGPIHTPSAQLPIYFQAGVNLRTVTRTQSQTRVHFAAPANFSWQVEGADTLDGNPVWQPVGTPVTGNDHFQQVVDPALPSEKRFYRMIGTPINP